jgi:uncharacterized protein
MTRFDYKEARRIVQDNVKEMVTMAKKVFLMFVAFQIVAFSSYLCLQAKVVGVTPWLAAYEGLANIGLTVGIWSIICQVLFMIVVCAFTQKIPRWGTILIMFLTGGMMDLYILWNPIAEIHSKMSAFFVFLFATALMGFGMALANKTFGGGARSELSIVLAKKWNITIKWASRIIEGIGLTIAFLFGGPIYLVSFFAGEIFSQVLDGSKKLLEQMEKKLALKY